MNALRCLSIPALCAIIAVVAGCGPGEPPSSGGPVAVRELTETQYRTIIADIFGRDIKIIGAFDPIAPADGLIAVGASRAGITPATFERYNKLGRGIATQVVTPENRATLIPCAPASESAPDPACAKTFFAKVGRLLYRRSLTAKETGRLTALADEVKGAGGSFYDGLAAGLTAMLVSPDFLLIGDVTEPDPDNSGHLRLDAYSRASRLSFMLWNAEPDDALLTSAEKGELMTKAGLSRQVDRMLDSPRVQDGVRAFFTDMLGFDGIQTLEKDPAIYPAFSLAAANDAQEQTLRTITDHLLTRNGDYRDLFTTRKTFLTRALGMLYRVSVEGENGWTPFEFPADDPHVGIQSEVSMLALYSHPGRSSATIRGKAVREELLCQKVPSPPANVDFTLVSDSSNPVYKTARQRLNAHANVPSCAGCHKIMDPIGLAMENFDGAGQFRTTENGAVIDTSGDLDNIDFHNSAELGHAIHDNSALTSCLVSRVYGYATGHSPIRTQAAWLDNVKKQFVESGYRIKPLLRAYAVSDGFYRISSASDAKSAAVASATPGKEDGP